MKVFVKNLRNEPLMPCKPSKARKLLKVGRAKIIDYKPFTIQLLYPTGEATQPIDIGIDLGAKHIGIAIQSQNKVLAKGEIELRDDVKTNLDARRTYRRSRRYRKTRYRKPRFDNRTKPKGWLPPSIHSRVNNTFNWIDKCCSLVPNPNLTIEVGKFDVQKMMNPERRAFALLCINAAIERCRSQARENAEGETFHTQIGWVGILRLRTRPRRRRLRYLPIWAQLSLQPIFKGGVK